MTRPSLLCDLIVCCSCCISSAAPVAAPMACYQLPAVGQERASPDRGTDAANAMEVSSEEWRYSDGEAADGAETGSAAAAAVGALQCFNCRHIVDLPPVLPPTVMCDNCGLPLPLSAQARAAAAELDTPPAQSASSAGCVEKQQHLQLLLDPCAVCGETMTSGPLCFLPCGHLIHDRHRLVHRHCSQCKPALPPYSAADRMHSPSAEEAEHYRRRKEAERARYGEEKGPCLPIFLEPAEVAQLLVYGEEDDTEERGREAMEQRTADVQRSIREKQSELEQQTAAEAHRQQRVSSRLETLAERRDSLARRRERSDNKKRRVEELRMDLYAMGRECSTLEKDINHLSEHVSRASEKDRAALLAEDGALVGSVAGDDDESSGRLQRTGSEQRKRLKSLVSDSDLSQSQLQALHVRYTHLHNSRIRQIERNDKEQEASSKQQSASEAAISALSEQSVHWSNKLATVQCEVSAMEKRRARRRRANSETHTNTAGRPQEATTASAGSGLNKSQVDALTSSRLTVPLLADGNSLDTSVLSSTPPARSHRRAAVASSAVTIHSSARPSVAASISSFCSSPASLSSPHSFSSASSRRFPSFSAVPPVAVRRQLSASGPAVSTAASAVTSKLQAARLGKRAAGEADRGAIDRFLHACNKR